MMKNKKLIINFERSLILLALLSYIWIFIQSYRLDIELNRIINMLLVVFAIHWDTIISLLYILLKKVRNKALLILSWFNIAIDISIFQYFYYYPLSGEYGGLSTIIILGYNCILIPILVFLILGIIYCFKAHREMIPKN